MNPGVVTGNDNTYSLNSVYDPDVTGVGHQPREFDVWAGLYGKYRVHSATVELWIRQRAAHGLATWMIPSNSAAPLVTANYPAELPRTVSLGVTGASQPIGHKVVKFDCAAILGQTSSQYMANEDTAAVVTASPTEQLYVHIWAQQIDGITVLDCEYECVITYDVEFYDRLYVGPSALMQHAALIARGANDGVVVLNPAPAPPPSTLLRQPVVSPPQPGLLRYVTGL
jgi:hypothetical protein